MISTNRTLDKRAQDDNSYWNEISESIFLAVSKVRRHRCTVSLLKLLELPKRQTSSTIMQSR